MKIVHKIEEGMNPKEILCTTYQMRDFFKQMADGFFSELDVMNYIQHYKIAKLCKKDWKILDICCGRSLMLPLLRYHAKDIKEYIGIDISEANIKNGYRDKKEYPFKVNFIIDNITELLKYYPEPYFDFIIYTSAIEHMQKEAGIKSLDNAFSVLKNNGALFLSCPNTYEKKDPYDCQYAAHLYEWDLNEIKDQLTKTGFIIEKIWGIVTKSTEFKKYIHLLPSSEQEIIKGMMEYYPREFLLPYISILHPEFATEVALLCKKPVDGNKTLF